MAAAAASAAPLLAQFVIPPPAPPPLPIPDEATITLGNVQQRMTVPVSINNCGPWNFVIDTGAERTVVSRELAGVLGLAQGPPVNVIAMTGSASVGTVVVPALSISTISPAAIRAPALSWRHLGAQGMLGVDSLQGHAVNIDFDRNRMTVKPSRKKRSTATHRSDEIVVVAKSLFGQLIVTDATVGRMKVAIIIDTGSPFSIGNGALLEQLKKKPRGIGQISAITATGGDLIANAYVLNNVAIGDVSFNDVPVAIADGAPFVRFGLEKRPAMLLGMDVLRLFRNVQIDFANREIRFTLPRSGRPAADFRYGA